MILHLERIERYMEMYIQMCADVLEYLDCTEGQSLENIATDKVRHHDHSNTWPGIDERRSWHIYGT